MSNFANMQFLTNHGNFNTYLHKIKKSNNATCKCGNGSEDAEHVLLQCILYNELRNNNFANLHEYMLNKENYQQFNILCSNILKKKQFCTDTSNI